MKKIFILSGLMITYAFGYANSDMSRQIQRDEQRRQERQQREEQDRLHQQRMQEMENEQSRLNREIGSLHRDTHYPNN